MEGLDTLSLARALERVFIALGGITSLILGTLLFRWGVSGEASLKARQDKNELQLLNAAPGIFFALFGAVILVWGLARPLDYRLPTANGEDKEAGATTVQVTYSDAQSEIDALLEEVLRVDPEAPAPRLQAQVQQIQQRARDLRQQLQSQSRSAE